MQNTELKEIMVSIDNGVAIVTMSSAPVNSLTVSVMNELECVFDQLLAQAPRAVVICSAFPKIFVAGADINQFVAWTPADGEATVTAGHRIFNKIERFPCPVIVAMDGSAFGGGVELAMACDIRVMAKGIKVALPEVTLGVYPGYGGTQRLARLVGLGRAKKMLFTGAPIDAEEAYRIGLCEVLAEKGEALAEAMKLAQQILKAAPVAVSTAKHVMNKGCSMPLKDGLALEIASFASVVATEDRMEGASAFLEKRTPVFTGR